MLSPQIDLFEHVAKAYAQPASGRLSNKDLYRVVTGRAGIAANELNKTSPVGESGQPRSLIKRKIRWHQQTLKQLGLIDRVQDGRALWELTDAGKDMLCKAADGVAVLGFSTDLGIAIWGKCAPVFERLDEPVFLALTSPPYPLRTPRAYGNPPIEEYIDFVCGIIEPVVRNLVTGGNIVLSLSNDIFESKSPARSLYLEKLTIALCERFGLSLMDRLIWQSNKAPGPVAWASKQRMQLNVGYEPLLWFCNSPLDCIANNRRVLEPHTARQQKLIDRGGEDRTAVSCDGAYRIAPGSYGNATAGKIPRNCFFVANNCPSQRAYKQAARNLGLQPHGASMPLALARKLVKFMTDVGQLVVDPCAGSMTTPLAAELEGRRWMGTDVVLDYVRGGAERFAEFDGFELALQDVC